MPRMGTDPDENLETIPKSVPCHSSSVNSVKGTKPPGVWTRMDRMDGIGGKRSPAVPPVLCLVSRSLASLPWLSLLPATRYRRRNHGILGKHGKVDEVFLTTKSAKGAKRNSRILMADVRWWMADARRGVLAVSPVLSLASRSLASLPWPFLAARFLLLRRRTRMGPDEEVMLARVTGLGSHRSLHEGRGEDLRDRWRDRWTRRRVWGDREIRRGIRSGLCGFPAGNEPNGSPAPPPVVAEGLAANRCIPSPG